MHTRDKPAAALVASAVTFTSPGTAENISSASQLAYVDEQEAFIQEAFTPDMTAAGTPTHVPLPLTILALILVHSRDHRKARTRRCSSRLMKWSHETESKRHLPWHKRDGAYGWASSLARDAMMALMAGLLLCADTAMLGHSRSCLSLSLLRLAVCPSSYLQCSPQQALVVCASRSMCAT